MDKTEQCKRVITDYLAACGPAEYADLLREVKAQAQAPGRMTKAMIELKNEGAIIFDTEFDCFDLAD